MESIKVIDNFTGDYMFLSNFLPCRVPLGQYGVFENSEAAYQAMKCPSLVDEFRTLTPEKAKKLGRSVMMRPDWEEVKKVIMYQVVHAKFFNNGYLATKLLETGTATLIEGNDWGDKYWGMVDGEGENHLGEILMQVRNELKMLRDPRDKPVYHVDP